MLFGCNCCTPTLRGFVAATDPLPLTQPEPIESLTDSSEVMFYNGTILTMTGEEPECVVIKNGVITFVGSMPRQPQKTDVNLNGGCLIPGLIDPHMHWFAAGLGALIVDVSPNAFSSYTRDNVMALLDSKVKHAHSTGQSVVLARGFDPSQIYTQTGHWQNLDVKVFQEQLSYPEICVAVQSGSGHLTYVNQAALDACHITLDTIPPAGGYIGRFPGENGALSGVIIETPDQELLGPVFSKAIPSELLRLNIFWSALRTVRDQALSRGVTTVTEAGLGMVTGHPDVESKILKMAAENKIRAAFIAFVDEWQNNPSFPSSPDTSDPMAYRAALKLFADGSNQGGTGLLSKSYSDQAIAWLGDDYLKMFPSGNKDTDVATLQNLIVEATNNGWQVLVHANGDQAVQNVIDAYAGASTKSKRALIRPRIEHCSLLTDKAISQLAEFGISPSFLIAHTTMWGKVLSEMLPNTWAENYLDRCASAAKANLRFSLHSDYPVSPLDPLQSAQWAVSRQMLYNNDKVLNPAECITPYQALKAITIDAAYQLQMDHLIGSLEVGKCADLVVLSTSPIAQNEFVMPTVQSTWVNGVNVYSNAS